MNARHTGLADAVLARLARVPGWVARPEVSFGVYGERGSVDLLAWHAARRVLLATGQKASGDRAAPRRT